MNSSEIVRTGSILAGLSSGHGFEADDDPEDGLNFNIGLVYLFIGLQLFGLFGSILIVAAALLSSVKRYGSWYNFIVSWIVSSLSYTLLFFGGQLKAQTVPRALCITQASLIYAAPPHTAASTLGLVVQVWFAVHEGLGKKPIMGRRTWIRVILLLPYVLWVMIVVEFLAFALLYPTSIKRTGSGMYCNTKIVIPGRISAALVTVMLILATIVEATIIFSLRKKWKAMRAQTVKSLVIRVTLFVIFGFFAVIISLTFTFMIHKGAQLNIVVSIIPVAAILIFGTQKDLFSVWLFWRKKSSEEEINAPDLEEEHYDHDRVSLDQSTRTDNSQQRLNWSYPRPLQLQPTHSHSFHSSHSFPLHPEIPQIQYPHSPDSILPPFPAHPNRARGSHSHIPPNPPLTSPPPIRNITNDTVFAAILARSTPQTYWNFNV